MLALSVTLCSAAVAPSPSISRRELGTLAGQAGLAGIAAPALAAATPTLPYTTQPGYKLNTGQAFPTASFGLQVYDDATAEKLTSLALEVGYRNFFASVLARNQRGFARAIKASGIPREELFICGSVLSNSVRGFADAKALSARGCAENMEAFSVGGIDYIDMIMLDYPGPDEDSLRGQWEALEEMQAAKLTRSLAVSNYNAKQLDVVLAMKGTVPTVNQLPYGVGFAGNYEARGGATAVLENNRKRGVLVQAWSPLRQLLRSSIAKDACANIGKKYGKSAAQVGLRYIADTGACFTTQTRTRAHFEEDLDIFDFKLTAEEVATLAAL